MTDYRPRNSDLLYRGRGRSGNGPRVVAVFASVAVTVVLLVMAYLTDAYNPASIGFAAAIPPRAAVAEQPALTPALSLAAASRSGS